MDNLREELKAPESKYSALKKVISLLHSGEDLNLIHSDVSKLAEAGNQKVRTLAEYFLRIYSTQNAYFNLVYRDVLFRRFKISEEGEIFRDDASVRGCIYTIKKLSISESPDTRISAIRAAEFILHYKKQLFYECMLEKCIRTLCFDTNTNVSCNATQVILELGWRSVLSTDDALILAKTRCVPRLRMVIPILSELYRENGLLQARDLLASFLSSNDLSVFYLASRELLKTGHEMTQLIFDKACGFLAVRPEQLFNLLSFIERLCGAAKYSWTLFMVYESDPVYIKKKKIDILLIDPTAASLNEVKHALKAVPCGVVLDVLRYALANSLKSLVEFILSLEALSSANKRAVLEIFRNATRDDEIDVGKYFESFDPEVAPELYLEVCGTWCNGVPQVIQRMDVQKHGYSLIDYFLGMFKLRKISKEVLIMYLKKMQLSDPSLKRIRILLEKIHLRKKETRIVFSKDFIEYEDALQPSCKDDALQPNCKDILGSKCRDALKSKLVPCSEDAYDSNQPEYKNQPGHEPQSESIQIDTPELAGVLKIENKEVRLEILEFRAPSTARYGVGNVDNQIEILKCEDIYLFTLEPEHRGQIFKMIVGEQRITRKF